MYITIAFFSLFVWHVVSELLHRRERKELADRLMARSFNEFKYYEEQFPKELKVAEKVKKKEVEKLFEEQKEEAEITEKFIQGLEEDWLPDEIDKKKIPEINNESEDHREENI